MMVPAWWRMGTGWLLATVCIQHLAWQLQAAPASGRCYASDRGYQCMFSPCATITMHWSIGAPAPDGPCRYIKPASSNGTIDAVQKLGGKVQDATLHIALVSTQYRGWVGISVPKFPNMMAPGDAVVALINNEGQGSVSPYALQSYQGDNPQETSYSVSDASVINDAAGLVMCFSRPLSAKGGEGISWGLDGGPLNFGASNQNSLGEHELRCTTCADCALPAVRLASFIDGFQPQAAVEEGSTPCDEQRVHRTHGWLMIVAWAILAPIGVLAPRYRLVLSKSPLVWQQPTSRWFTFHTALQFLATLFFAISCGIIMKYEGWQPQKWSELMKAHAGIGIAMIVMLAIHLCLALIRPAPDAKHRPVWRVLHISGAIITVVLAFINLMMGPKVYWVHSLDASGAKGMYVAVFVSLLLVLMLAAFLHWCNKRIEASEVWAVSSPTSSSASDDLESPYKPFKSLMPQPSSGVMLTTFPVSTYGQ